MPLLVVRHARAGSRRRWEGADEERPLSGRGRKQAASLAKLLLAYEPKRILTSPYVRCIQTVEPLAAKLGLTLEHADALAEGATADPVLALALALESRGSSVALCTHGDVVVKLLDTLAGTDELELPRDYPCAKGSTWVLLERDGRFVEARYLPAKG